MYELDILRWFHILAIVYWLGAEWGVYQLSLLVTNRELSLEERERHRETVHRIDVLQRTGLVLLLPLGLHMGKLLGYVPFLEGSAIWVMWMLAFLWLSLGWVSFWRRDSVVGLRATRLEEFLRYPIIGGLFVFAVLAFQGVGPIRSGPGDYWYPAKMALYAVTLCIGLYMRFIIRSWTVRFQALAQGPDPAQESALEREIRVAKVMAWMYWLTIAGTALVGSLKSF